MITYNSKEWFKLIFQFHKSDTFRILFPTMLLLGSITTGLVFFEKKYFDLEVPSLTIFHQIAGFIISMVLVFRINTGYDRWWEGRKLWGSLMNVSRNISIQLNAFIPQDDLKLRKEVHQLLCNYPFALKEHLRRNNTIEDIKFTSTFTQSEYEKTGHKPNCIAKHLSAMILDITKRNPHTQNDYLILSQQINQLTEICGACERIKTTPIPYSYSIFIKKMIFLYIITMPVTFGLTIGYWAVPIVMIMFYAFASLELISEEIEDPFGTDSNDLPTDEISVRIKETTREILIGNDN